MFTVDSHVEGEWQTTRVRVLQSSWGMAVDLVARATTEVLDLDGDGLVRVASNLMLDVRAVRVDDAEVRALVDGLRLMVPAVPTGTDATTVQVRDLRRTRPDYQPEVTTIAMSHWLAAHLDVEPPAFDVVYDRATDRYWVSP